MGYGTCGGSISVMNLRQWILPVLGLTVMAMPMAASAQGQETLRSPLKSLRLNRMCLMAPEILQSIQPQPGGRLTISNGNLRMLIRFAYNVDDTQISGGPPWIDSDRYDIVAKGEGDATTDQLRQMLQTLLSDRFCLKIHRESKELPVYNLVVAKSGAKLKQVEGEMGGPPNQPNSRMMRGGLRAHRYGAARPKSGAPCPWLNSPKLLRMSPEGK